MSWSPKGKQIMVGKHDGSSSQYDHELKLKKDWPAPTILTEPQQGKALPKTKPRDTENVHFVSVHFKVRLLERNNLTVCQMRANREDMK